MRNDCNNALCEGTNADGCKKCGIAPRHPHLGDETRKVMGLLHIHADADPEDIIATAIQSAYEAGLTATPQ